MSTASTRTEAVALAETVALLTPILRLLDEAEELPGYLPLLRAVRRLNGALRASLGESWRGLTRADLPGLWVACFRTDLEVERAREAWRQAAGKAGQDRRHVRTQWVEKVAASPSLTDMEKQRVTALLRASSLLEAEEGGSHLEVLLQAVQVPEVAADAWREEFAAAFRAAMEEAGNGAAAQLGLGVDWALKDPNALAHLEQYAGYYGDRLSKLVELEHQQTLREAILSGLDAGEGAEALGQRIRDCFSDLNGYQAERIARTEAARARSEGAHTCYLENGVQEEEWVVGGNPCPELCAPRAGHVYSIHDFPEQPAHPHCLCSRVASEADLERIRREALAGTGEVGELSAAAGSRYRQSP